MLHSTLIIISGMYTSLYMAVHLRVNSTPTVIHVHSVDHITHRIPVSNQVASFKWVLPKAGEMTCIRILQSRDDLALCFS